MTDFRDQLTETAARVAEFMDSLLPLDDVPERRLIEAMRYATVAGGKRIRPFMVVAGARMFGVAEESSLRTAAAIEMIHCYSLVHDDLPAMDDDDLRRGQPTCHRQFDEATAILAGDGLLTQAFEVLAHPATHSDPAVRADLVLEMAKAAGPQGMVGGQMADLRAEEVRFGIDEITRMQRMKTGALIAFSCEAGAILGKAPPQARTALKAYAHDLGLAFQIVDDLLDVEGDEKEVGKKVRKDADAGKATFVSLLGLERAREQARLLGDQAVRHLEIFAEKADPLRGLAAFILNRRS